jgi:hypothetical protein
VTAGGAPRKIEDPYDGHLNAEELTRSLLDLVMLYGRAVQEQVGGGAGDGGSLRVGVRGGVHAMVGAGAYARA